jgi:rubrerythrin
MDIFDYAMKMEEDGRAFYLEQVEKTTVPQLKKIWQQLADDELKHYNLFKALRDGEKAQYDDRTQTTILKSVKNVFEELKASGQDFSFTPDVEKAWMEAREVEKKSEDFYREKVPEVDSEAKKNALTRIADEEHRHYVTLDNVIQFLQRPQNWLEDAEWNHLEDY